MIKRLKPLLVLIFMISNLIFVENYAIHDFSVLLRTGSNPPDINRFRSHTVKMINIPDKLSRSKMENNIKLRLMKFIYI